MVDQEFFRKLDLSEPVWAFHQLFGSKYNFEEITLKIIEH